LTRDSWALSNKGKRSGVRVIYYWNHDKEQIFLMTLYAKNEVADLTEKEKKALKVKLETMIRELSYA
jgi:hypothetical protein